MPWNVYMLQIAVTWKNKCYPFALPQLIQAATKPLMMVLIHQRIKLAMFLYRLKYRVQQPEFKYYCLLCNFGQVADTLVTLLFMFETGMCIFHFLLLMWELNELIQEKELYHCFVWNKLSIHVRYFIIKQQ